MAPGPETLICPACGKSFPHGTRFCPEHGRPLVERPPAPAKAAGLGASQIREVILTTPKPSPAPSIAPAPRPAPKPSIAPAASPAPRPAPAPAPAPRPAPAPASPPVHAAPTVLAPKPAAAAPEPDLAAAALVMRPSAVPPMVTSAVQAVSEPPPQILGSSLPAASAQPFAGLDPASVYIGQTIYSQFVVEELVGVGSTGTVFRAKQLGIGRPVALKVLHPELRSQKEIVARFKREGQIASKISHPNIVHLYLTGLLPDGNLFLAMEYVTGGALSKAMEPGGMALERVVHIADQVLAALGEAHKAGIVHRDLKPENVMLTRVGDDSDFVKVLDFGIAKLVDHKTVASRSGLVFGSPKYISPEAAGGDEVDARSDLYSCGMILYEMLAGRPAFEAEKPIDLLMMQIRDAPPRLSSVRKASALPIAVEAVIHQAIEKKPEHRFRSADVFAEALWSASGADRSKARRMGGAVAVRKRDVLAQTGGADSGPGGARAVAPGLAIASAVPAPLPGSPAPVHAMPARDPLAQSTPHAAGSFAAPVIPEPVPHPAPPPSEFLIADPTFTGAEPPPRDRKMWLWFGIGAFVVVAIAVALVLIFAGGKPSGSSSPAADAGSDFGPIEPVPAPVPPTASAAPIATPAVPTVPPESPATPPVAPPVPPAVPSEVPDAGAAPPPVSPDAGLPPDEPIPIHIVPETDAGAVTRLEVVTGPPPIVPRPDAGRRDAGASRDSGGILHPANAPDVPVVRVTNPKDGF